MENTIPNHSFWKQMPYDYLILNIKGISNVLPDSEYGDWNGFKK